MNSIIKILKYLAPLFLLAFVLYGLFWLKGFEYGKTDPRGAISKDNIFFIETKNLNNIVNEVVTNDIWADLKDIPEFSAIDSVFRKLTSIEFDNDIVKELFNEKAVLAVNKETPDKVSLLLIIKPAKRVSEKHLKSIIRGSKMVDNISKNKFKGASVYSIKFKSDQGIKDISYSLIKGLLITSFSMKQLENAILALDEEEERDPVYRYHRLKLTTSGNVAGNIYFNFKAIDQLNSIINLFSSTSFNSFASSAGYDLEFGKDKIVFNGFITIIDSSDNSLKIISGEPPGSAGLMDFIPASARFFFQLSFSNGNKFFREQTENNFFKPDLNKLAGINEAYSINIRNFIEGMAGNEFGLVVSEREGKDSPFFITQVKSGSNTEEQFKNWLDLWTEKNNKKADEYHFKYKIDNQQSIRIYCLPIGGIPGMVYGKAFRSVEQDYFTIYMNHLIFGNSVKELGEFVYQLILGRNITGTEGFKNVKDNILSRSNLFIYMDPYKTARMYSPDLGKESQGFLRSHSKILEKFSVFTIQINAADDLFYSRAFLNYSGNGSEFVNTTWISRMDSVNIIKPAIVLNHTNNEKEIIVQDAKFQLYLISNSGRVIWKLPLDGPVLSEVHQIDFYKNGKLQYLFNTKNKIYLIDRIGNPVEKYPVTLRSPATNGLSLFDYEQDGNHRICIACENRQIYLYDREGRTISGWSPSPTDHIIEKNIQYFRVDRKDYIVASDRYKTYVLDRQGKVRVHLSKNIPVSPNNPFYLDISKGKEKARLVSTDTLGNILYIYLSGNIHIEQRENIDSQHYFILSDLNGNGRFEYITVSNNKLVVNNSGGSLVFEHEFEGQITRKPFIYEFSGNDRKIGIILGEIGKIYLLGNDGAIYNGFPLKGSSLFSISNFPGLNVKFNLIVGNNDNFLYNYSVK